MNAKELRDKLDEFEDNADVLVVDEDGTELDIISIHQEFRTSHFDGKDYPLVIIEFEFD